MTGLVMMSARSFGRPQFAGLLILLLFSAYDLRSQSAGVAADADSVSQTLASIRSMLDSGKVSQPEPQSFPDTGSPGSSQGMSGDPVSANGIFLGTIPSVGGKVTAFRFFSSDSDLPPPQAARQYTDRFSRAGLKTIYYELTVEYAVDSALTYIVSSTWFLQRKRLARQDVPMTKPADWRLSTRAYGYGHREPGRWEPGTYTVEIEVADQKVASGTFTVY